MDNSNKIRLLCPEVRVDFVMERSFTMRPVIEQVKKDHVREQPDGEQRSSLMGTIRNIVVVVSIPELPAGARG